jgi:hypothetical protein
MNPFLSQIYVTKLGTTPSVSLARESDSSLIVDMHNGWARKRESRLLNCIAERQDFVGE